MLGWMLIFTLIAIGGTMSALNAGMAATAGVTSSVVFGFLLVISAFTLLLRGRA